MSLKAGILDNLLQIIPLNRVQNIEKVLAVRHSSLGHLRREEVHEFLVSLHHWPELHHSQFVIKRNVNPLNFVKFQELLIVNKDLFQEILIEHVFRRAVQLD